MPEQEESEELDPRTSLAEWANDSDEWARAIVREVLSTGKALGDEALSSIYELYCQEKGLDKRTRDSEPAIEVELGVVQREAALSLKKLYNLQGVNALRSGVAIEFHEGLTILFGENGTGKTGYARVFKALANSRSADAILPNIHEEVTASPSADLDYELGGVPGHLSWQGERGGVPFSRMSVFDSPAVNLHVDDDLSYVYTPATLALFNHVNKAIQAVQARAEAESKSLKSNPATILSRFKRTSELYPLIETLGASTDIDDLAKRARTDEAATTRVDELQRTIGALRSNATQGQLAAARRALKVLDECLTWTSVVSDFDFDAQQAAHTRRGALAVDYALFRSELFAAANLPAEPDDSWEAFIEAGEAYRQHLEEQGVASAGSCLYCRQDLSPEAADLLARYAAYLQDKLATDIAELDRVLEAGRDRLATSWNNVSAYLGEAKEASTIEKWEVELATLHHTREAMLPDLLAQPVPPAATTEAIERSATVLARARAEIAANEASLQIQLQDAGVALTENERELAELEGQIELGRVLPQLRVIVEGAKRADRLSTLARKLPPLQRQVTELSKVASQQLINNNFEALFAEECRALRAPDIKVEFVGRQGVAQRRKVLRGSHRPSLVLSEGEQKVLALADFLAEARLTGITAPIIFDDPVSSLDHRRINEVADRVTSLADDNQVIVFTHDILFATNLLARFEKSKRCVYYQVTDDGGKGEVAHATGPRWDTVKFLTGKVNEAIQDADRTSAEERAAHVRTGYDWIRSWCEVFVEMEVLQGVTQRYQPNVMMGALDKIKSEALPGCIATVNEVFNRACRLIDGHSQPLASQTTSPKLAELKADWETLKTCRTDYLNA